MSGQLVQAYSTLTGHFTKLDDCHTTIVFQWVSKKTTLWEFKLGGTFNLCTNYINCVRLHLMHYWSMKAYEQVLLLWFFIPRIDIPVCTYLETRSTLAGVSSINLGVERLFIRLKDDCRDTCIGNPMAPRQSRWLNFEHNTTVCIWGTNFFICKACTVLVWLLLTSSAETHFSFI